MNAVTPRIGRPRSAEADEAIHAAAVAEILERGFEGVSMEALAERAGVGKATIYRRFSSREDLLVSVMQRCVDEVTPEPAIDTGSLRGDLEVGVDRLVLVLTKTDIGRLWPRFACEQSDPRMDEIRANFKALRRQPLIEAIERAKQRGEVRPDVDAEVALDLLMGPVLARFLMGHRVFPARWRAEIIDLVARGMG